MIVNKLVLRGPAALLGLALAVAVPAPAQANYFGTCQYNSSGTPVNCPDTNRNHWFGYDSNLGTTGWRDSMELARRNSYDPTDLVTLGGVSHADSDVWLYIGVQNLNYYAHNACLSEGPTGFCTHAHVEIYSSSTSTTNVAMKRSIMCYEAGHTVGLRHTDPVDNARTDLYGCMVNGDQFPDLVGPHPVEHLNQHY